MKEIKLFPKGDTSNPFSNINWPKLCPFCYSEANLLTEAAITYGKNLKCYGVFYTLQTHTYSIKFPICQKHKKLCDISSYFSKMSLVSLFVLLLLGGGLFYTSILALGVWANLTSLSYWVANITFSLILVVYFVFKYKFPPIKISHVDKKSLTVRMPSKYFEYFKKANC